MSAYKKLNRQDVYVSDYVAKKQWSADGTTVTGYNIETLRGFSGSTPGYPYPKDYLIIDTKNLFMIVSINYIIETV